MHFLLTLLHSRRGLVSPIYNQKLIGLLIVKQFRNRARSQTKRQIAVVVRALPRKRLEVGNLHRRAQRNAFRRRDARQKYRSIGSTAYGDRTRAPALRVLLPSLVCPSPLPVCYQISVIAQPGAQDRARNGF